MGKNILDILKSAYEAEKDGLRAYLTFAKQTKVASGKNMFIQLALDEVDHMELIEKMMNKVIGQGSVDSIVVPDTIFKMPKPELKDVSLQQVDEGSMGDLEALKVALEHEKKAIEFYKEHAEKSENTELKAFFEKLAEVEERHYDIIQAEIDSISGNGFWFDAIEFSLEQ